MRNWVKECLRCRQKVIEQQVRQEKPAVSGRKAKKKVIELLAGENLESILVRLAEIEARDVVHGLFSGICSSDEKVHWNAVACMGFAVARLAEQDMEEARVIMRRLLWSLNDESGGIGWGAPETLAEIMVHHKGLADEYIHMLISYMREDGEELFQDGNYLEHETLQRGLLWGVARVAAKRPDMLLERGVVKDLVPYLHSQDAMVRALAAKSLGLLGAVEALEDLNALQDDDNVIRFLENGSVSSVRVGEIVSEASRAISAKGSV